MHYAAEVEAIMGREFDGSKLEEQPLSYNRLANLRHYGLVARVQELLTTHPDILSASARELLALGGKPTPVG